MSTRRSIGIPGVDHGSQPFPLASRVGPFLATSGIHGTDPRTGALVEGADAQIRQAFANLRSVVEAAGGSVGDIAQVLVTLQDRSDRSIVNDVWLELFPEAGSRPARNTSERELAGGSLCSLVAYAWISDEATQL